jgi:Uma2 family endonuclease
MSTIQTRTRDAWSRALSDPQLQDLSYKIETNEHGQLVLTPHKLRHSLHQTRIATMLRDLAPDTRLPRGEPAVELAVETPWGVKVPDVVWISEERLAKIPEDAAASPVMPELVIEVLSESNTRTEMEEKRRVYFAGGAQEVWTCDPVGRMTFYDADGEISRSKLAPAFPTSI